MSNSVLTSIPRTPCPEINVKDLRVNPHFTTLNGASCSTFSSKFEIAPRHIPGASCDDPGRCIFDATLWLDIPIARPPCAEFDVNFSLTTGYAGFGEDGTCVNKESVFKIEPKPVDPQNCKDPGQCKFDVTLDIVVPFPKPPCPEINVSSVVISSGYADTLCAAGENKLEIIPRHEEGTDCNDPGKCIFDVDLAIHIPIPRTPCPEFDVSFSVVSGYVGFGADGECVNRTSRFSIEKRPLPPPTGCDEPESCVFDVVLDIVVPIPRPVCPEFYTNFVVKSGFADTDCTDGENRFEIYSSPPRRSDELQRPRQTRF
jgi:hypothetical protein